VPRVGTAFTARSASCECHQTSPGGIDMDGLSELMRERGEASQEGTSARYRSRIPPCCGLRPSRCADGYWSVTKAADLAPSSHSGFGAVHLAPVRRAIMADGSQATRTSGTGDAAGQRRILASRHGQYHCQAARGGVSVLVGGAVFKTVVAEDLGQGGSIPLRLRTPCRSGSTGALVNAPEPTGCGAMRLAVRWWVVRAGSPGRECRLGGT
jgi:hypothetical protein